MGLGQSQNQTTFLKIKDGNFYLGSDKECTTPYRSVEGHVSNMYFRKESFDGKEFEKLYVSIQDEETNYTFGIGISGSTFPMLVGFLKNTNINDPIKFSAGTAKNSYEKNGKVVNSEYNMIYLSQDDQNIKSFYNKESGNKLPAWEKVQAGKSVVWVKDAYEDALRTDIDEMVSKIGNRVHHERDEAVSTLKPASPPQPSMDDDLPF